MRGLALYWGWGARKLAVLDKLLGELVTVDAGLPEVIAAYAELFAEAMRAGHPAGENDLWIAATAMVTQAELFTCDRDFAWLHPAYLAVRTVAEQS